MRAVVRAWALAVGVVLAVAGAFLASQLSATPGQERGDVPRELPRPPVHDGIRLPELLR
ncbi:hypothetical protein [Actinocorallia longicatena]|uniref:Uncharacterized protein n=1 Tax=Actinocorallia longicatena TaxID=111803 RepID=A0ABP6QMU6_9ACTN